MRLVGCVIVCVVAIAAAAPTIGGKSGAISGGVNPATTVTGSDGRVRAGPPVIEAYTGQGFLNHKQDSERLYQADDNDADPRTYIANPALDVAPEDLHAQQMQPEGYDNFRRSIPNWFQHEIIYVENGIVLIWKPVTGQWSTHRLNRDCGPDCPLIPERPMYEGEWPDLKYHKLIFLGCHQETRHAHILDQEPTTGKYKIWLFDSSKPEPLVHLAAQSTRLDMTTFTVSYMAQNEILLHEGEDYRVYIVEPKLPLTSVRIADPIGPRHPIDVGKFPFKEQVVYVGDRRVMDYSSQTGQYSVYAYDRGAMDKEPPVSRLLAEGELVRGHVVTVVGNETLVLFNPMTGRYKAVGYNNDYWGADFIKPQARHTYWGLGSVMEADMCRIQSKCSSCIAMDGCGWCDTVKECFRGNHDGPCTTNCSSWEMNICPAGSCSEHKACSNCVADPFCGYCADSKTCTEGTLGGPLFGDCDYRKLECPVLNKEEQEGGCVDEIG